MRVFPEKVSIWIGELSKDDCPQCRWALSNLNRTRMQRKGEFGLCWAGMSIFPCPWTYCSCFPGLQPGSRTYTVGFLILRPLTQTEFHHWLSSVSFFQMANCGTSQPPQLCKPIPVLRLILYTCIYPAGFVSQRTLPDASSITGNPEGKNSYASQNPLDLHIQQYVGHQINTFTFSLLFRECLVLSVSSITPSHSLLHSALSSDQSCNLFVSLRC